MPLLTLADAELAFGDLPLLDRASFAMEAGERIGLIGRNGTGKSSLLGVITGRLALDGGELKKNSGLRIAFVPQEPEDEVDATVPKHRLDTDTAAEQEDLRRLARAVKEPDLAQRWKKLGAVLDVERFIPFLATEVLVWHQGGYGLDHGNYRIYHQPASDLLVFLPHDLDRLCAKHDAPILPEWQGLAAKALVETPAGRQHYLESLQKQLDELSKRALL